MYKVVNEHWRPDLWPHIIFDLTFIEFRPRTVTLSAFHLFAVLSTSGIHFAGKEIRGLEPLSFFYPAQQNMRTEISVVGGSPVTKMLNVLLFSLHVNSPPLYSQVSLSSTVSALACPNFFSLWGDVNNCLEIGALELYYISVKKLTSV